MAQAEPSSTPLRRHATAVWLGLLCAWYLLATLPYLEAYPILDASQMGIMAPAHKLAAEGVYGNDLYRGLYRAERRNYEYMPLYALAVAASFKLWGLGIWQARLVSILCGWGVVWLTYRLGKKAVNRWVGLGAATALCLVAITVPATMRDLYPGAIPLFDFARVVRYDIMAVMWVLAASLLFLHAVEKGQGRFYFAAGVLAGLATLSQLYGAFILVVWAVLIWWQGGERLRPLLWVLAGWGLVLLPWLWYVGQDLAAYQGQMLRHESRFDLLNPRFYVNNLAGEIGRYSRFVGRFRAPVLWPRPGFWLMLLATAVSFFHLGQQARRHPTPANRFLLLCLPLFVLLFALLISFKRYTYTALLLPFLMLHTALGVWVIWQRLQSRRRVWRGLLLCLLGLVALEGMWSVGQSWQQARSITPYANLSAAIEAEIPSRSRLLIQHVYWLGLAEHDTYAIDLAYNLSDPDFAGAAAQPVTAVITQIDPNFIIVPQHLLTAYRRNPDSLPHEKLITFWQGLDGYIQENCAQEVTRVQSEGYGVVSVYHCRETNP